MFFLPVPTPRDVLRASLVPPLLAVVLLGRVCRHLLDDGFRIPDDFEEQIEADLPTPAAYEPAGRHWAADLLDDDDERPSPSRVDDPAFTRLRHPDQPLVIRPTRTWDVK
jgi:hypothetical protein